MIFFLFRGRQLFRSKIYCQDGCRDRQIMIHSTRIARTYQSWQRRIEGDLRAYYPNHSNLGQNSACGCLKRRGIQVTTVIIEENITISNFLTPPLSSHEEFCTRIIYNSANHTNLKFSILKILELMTHNTIMHNNI